MTMKKLSAPVVKIPEVAGKDIAAMIQDAAEAWIGRMKQHKTKQASRKNRRLASCIWQHRR